MLTFQESTLLMKLFYQNRDSTTESLWKVRSLKRLRKGPLSSQRLTNMIWKFEASETLEIQPKRRPKGVTAHVVDDGATQVEEDRSQTIRSSSIGDIAASVNQPRSTSLKILRNTLRYYPNQLSQMLQLLPDDLDSRQTLCCGFSHELSSRMSFHGTFWGETRPTFIWKLQIICTIPIFGLARRCDTTTVFIQYGTPPHIACLVKKVLRHNSGVDRIISRHFPTVGTSRSPDLNPCDFCLWGYVKDMFFWDPVTSLPDLKESTERHVHNIPQFMLLSTVEHTVLRF
ncbi:uncharacterized protein TNCV_1741101 [Trichonephila clavipes]|uniref:DUF4817 domain-containing protein n=1 Tax=Trichonephila clavipes TaxID=2585209 RepID=A0A8X6RKM5_TRICX|nr:uncharacterized protein TNCV_1741101 [Trichonephila clavipes]